jgi:hypothetical protein
MRTKNWSNSGLPHEKKERPDKGNTPQEINVGYVHVIHAKLICRNFREQAIGAILVIIDLTTIEVGHAEVGHAMYTSGLRSQEFTSPVLGGFHHGVFGKVTTVFVGCGLDLSGCLGRFNYWWYVSVRRRCSAFPRYSSLAEFGVPRLVHRIRVVCVQQESSVHRGREFLMGKTVYGSSKHSHHC